VTLVVSRFACSFRHSLRRHARRLARHESGITLIELLTSMSILMVVIGALGTTFVSGTNAEVNMNRRFQSQTNARLALSTLRREVHNSCSLSITTNTVAKTQDVTLYVLTPGPVYDCPPTSVGSTWCTRGSGTRFKLYRKVGSTCSTAGVKWADYLTTYNVFSTPTVGADELPKLGIDFTVDPNPAASPRLYELVDAIALRNAPRS